ncbi:hypothetical protein P9295_03335, partial [Bacillus badius]|nr:hypothetical protein [Bacillus badius]
MENLRDMAIRIAMDADSDPLADIRREMAEMQREARRLSREVNGLGSSFNNSYGGMIEESQALNQQVNRQSRVIRSLARDMGTSATRLASQWGDMSEGVRRSLIRNHNNLRQYRRQLRGIEGDMLSLSNQMGHYTGSTNDFMREVQRMGADHKQVTDRMINSNIALRASYVRQAATMLNLSTTSSKINKIYAQSGNALYQVNRPLLAVTDSMERLARQGDPVVVALRQLGPNASMKELQDRINLINTGIMRQQSLLMVAGVAWLGFTAILANAAMGPDVEKNLAAQAQAWADYKQALAQRTQEIYSTFSLFERVQIQKTSPRRLYLNLQEQLKVMKGWQTNLHSLAKKGVDEGLIAELRKMGPSAAGEIAALNRMSDKGLNEYTAMWREKHKLARTAATTELEKLRQQTAAKVQRLKDSLKPLGVAVYEFQNIWADALAPFIDFWGQLASYVVKAGTKVGEFVQKLNEISPWITKLAGMFTYLSLTMLVILTPMAIGIGYIQGMRVAFTAAWTVIKPFALGLASVGGTAMLVAAGIIVLGAALYLAWTRSEKFRNAVIDGWTAIKQTATNVWGTIKPLILNAFEAITSFGKQKLTQLKTFWKENGEQILQAAKNVWAPISTVIKTTLGAVWSVMKFVWPAVLLLIKSVWGNIKGVINGGLQVILGVVKFFSSLFTGNFRGMWEATKQIFFGAIQFIWNFIQLSFFGKILGAGKAFILTFRAGFSALWTGIKSIFAAGVTGTRNLFVGGFTWLKNFAGNIVHAMTTGITNRFMAMVNQARTIFSLLRQWGENIFRALWNTIRSMVGNIVVGVRTGFTTMKNKAVELATGMKNAVTNRFTAIVDAAKALPGKIGAGIKSMAKYAMGGIKHLSNSMISGLAQGVNGVGKGVNWVFEKIGVESRIPEWKPPKYAKGTDFHPGGPAIVGDGGGPELIRTPAGQVGLSPGTSTLVHLPRGTEVLPHRETNALMNAPAYHSGSLGDGVLHGAYNAVKEKASNAWQGAKDVAGSAWEGTKNAVGKAKDLALDVFSYI